MQTKTRLPWERNQLAAAPPHIQAAADSYPHNTPVEYIVGSAQFYGRSFFVSEATLIPRVETEELVQLALSDLQADLPNTQENISLLEVGAGSGAISVTMALEFAAQTTQFAIDAVDVSQPALAVAQKNTAQYAQDFSAFGTITTIHGDLLDAITNLQKYDGLIANLPYIPTQQVAELDTSVRRYEPDCALDGGSDGFSLIAKLLDQLIARDYKKSVWLEIDTSHTHMFWKPYEQHWRVELIHDSFERLRFARLNPK